MTPDDAHPPGAGGRQRKQVLLRLDPQVYEALARWAGEELRSTNAQIEFLLRRALGEAGRLPGGAAPIARRGRPPGRAGGTPPRRPGPGRAASQDPPGDPAGPDSDD